MPMDLAGGTAHMYSLLTASSRWRPGQNNTWRPPFTPACSRIPHSSDATGAVIDELVPVLEWPVREGEAAR